VRYNYRTHSAKWQNLVDQFSYFFTIKFRKDLWRKLELKLLHPLKSAAALYLVKRNYIHI